MTTRIRRLAVLLLAAGSASGALFGTPPDGTERIDTFARLLRAEDTRSFDRDLFDLAVASPDAWLRRKAALAAGRLRDPQVTERIAGLLGDPEATVRQAAAFAAGVSGDRRLVAPLIRALADPDVRTAIEAAFALGKVGGPEAETELLSALERPSPTRAAAAMALWRSSETRVLVRLRALVLDPSVPADVRRSAVYALSRRPQKESAAALRAVLSVKEGEGDPDAMAWAARGCGILKEDAAAADLIRLAGSRSTSIAVQSLLALEKIFSSSNVATAAAGAHDVTVRRARDPIPGVAVAALRLLGSLPANGEARKTLEEVLRRKGWRGQTALVSLTRLDVPLAPDRAANRLSEAASSDSLELKLGACEAMEFVSEGVAESIGAVLLSDGSARARAAAVSSLSKRKAPIPDERLLSALKDSSPSVRAAALEAAAPRLAGAPALVPAWEEAFASSLGTGEPDDAVTALEGAASRGEAARGLISARVNDPNAVVRAKARLLMVEKFGAAPGSFPGHPVASGGSMDHYRELARLANGVAAGADVRTTRGTFRVALDFGEAPATSLSFVTLAKRGFFDGLLIHRVVPDFVVQTGDPRGDGSGGPGYVLRDELNPLTYQRGTVGMALSGPDTGGSQWFVALAPQPHLDGGYTVFARVVSGLEVLDRIEQDDRLVSVTIREKSR